MVWIYPQQKYRQIKYAYYDASQKEHFCQPGENWGAFTAQECERVISLSKEMKLSKGIVDGKIKPEIRQVNVWGLSYSESTRWLWEKLINSVKYANNKWWNYDIYGIMDSMQLLCYEASKNQESIQDHYNKHIDVGEAYYYRKISISAENYICESVVAKNSHPKKRAKKSGNKKQIFMPAGVSSSSEDSTNIYKN